MSCPCINSRFNAAAIQGALQYKGVVYKILGLIFRKFKSNFQLKGLELGAKRGFEIAALWGELRSFSGLYLSFVKGLQIVISG